VQLASFGKEALVRRTSRTSSNDQLFQQNHLSSITNGVANVNQDSAYLSYTINKQLPLSAQQSLTNKPKHSKEEALSESVNGVKSLESIRKAWLPTRHHEIT